MFGVATSDDSQPIAWVGRHPVHVTTLLVALHVFTLVVACLLLAFGVTGFIGLFVFDNAQVIAMGRVWQIFTYAFVHVPTGTSLLFFAIEMAMLFIFGREVERFIGRRAFIGLYALLLWVPTVFLTIAGGWTRLGLAGSTSIHFGIFLAFATIYPQAELFLRIQARWVALAFVAFGTLASLANHDWAYLITLLTTVATAVLFIRSRGIGPEWEWWNDLKSRFQRKPKFHVVRQASTGSPGDPENVHESIDPVLDKISKYGIQSLTPSERRTLDRARASLLKKEP